MSFQQLPPDMKRKMAETVDPAEALELCKSVKCDQKRLLDLNYDFVTQGFAVGKTDQEKFKYLAERVSKNIGVEDPKIIFIHFEGIPLGKTTFFDQNDEDDEEYLNDLKARRKAIVEQIEESPAVEWLQEDEYNAWISVKDSKNLPRRFEVHNDEYNTVLEDTQIYDYPPERISDIKEFSPDVKYPGIVKIDSETIQETVDKILEGESEEDLDAEIDQIIVDMMYATPQWRTYSMMLNGYSRSEAEVFSRIVGAGSEGEDYFKNLETIRQEVSKGKSEEKRLIVYLNKEPVLKFYIKPEHTLADIQNYFHKKYPNRKIEFYKDKKKANWNDANRIFLK